jgi:uncharacterized membrane protein YeaQ/YmgE (transglycosylase-associated protein family)
MGLCGWIVFGFFAGLVARAVMPGEQKMGFIATTVLGVAGAFTGGVLSTLLFGGGQFHYFQPSGFIGAVIGALLLLAAGGAMNQRRHRR